MSSKRLRLFAATAAANIRATAGIPTVGILVTSGVKGGGSTAVPSLGKLGR